MMSGKKRVLFVCIHNSARSQMAEAFLKSLAGDRFDAASAGIDPGSLNPIVVESMKETGIDISGNGTKSVQDMIAAEEAFDYVITVCDQANESCPYFLGGKERIHKGFRDPAVVGGNEMAKLTAFRQARDVINAWLKEKFG